MRRRSQVMRSYWGQNELADAVASRLRDADVIVHRVAARTTEELDAELDRLWSTGETPHLFLTSANDKEAVRDVLDVAAFELRRSQAIDVPYRLCQRWMQRMIDQDLMDTASLITLLQGGGDFGLGDEEGNENRDPSNREDSRG